MILNAQIVFSKVLKLKLLPDGKQAYITRPGWIPFDHWQSDYLPVGTRYIRLNSFFPDYFRHRAVNCTSDIDIEDFISDKPLFNAVTMRKIRVIRSYPR